MADALLSALVSTVLGSLNSLLLEEFGIAGGLTLELQNLGTTLATVNAVLQDAEERQFKSEAIKIWLEKLKDKAYDLDNVLDECRTQALRRRLLRDVRSQVSNFFSSENPLLFRLKVTHKLKNVRQQLDAIAEERLKFHLRESVVDIGVGYREDRLMTSSLVDESEIFARNGEVEDIINELLNNSADSQHGFSVYAIWGMGGVGKTTLAQLVYNDERVKIFEVRIWVCVSDDFDIIRLTKAIVQSIDKNESCQTPELDPLQRCLEEKLSGKRFLLVLDDVWNEYHEKWDRLKHAFRCGAKGSTVIVTTRNENIALMMATVRPVRHLGCLSDEDSWSLFKLHAFGMGNITENYAHLEIIGKEIVRKCGGVPLAVKALGRMMLECNENEWLRVRDSKIWDLEEEGSRILPALRLSYDHLRPYLRQCFSFCAVFPKDYVMAKDRLIQLWMANGFIPSREQVNLHDMGCKIFNELARRSFFQDIQEDNGGNITCRMHDLMHDLAYSIMQRELYVIDHNKEVIIPQTVRHLSVISGSVNVLPSVVNKGMRSLRSLTQFQRNGIYHLCYAPWSKQKYLRVLDFSGRPEDHSKIPIDIWKHLRYLNLSRSWIESLPESMSYLLNLQTLDLKKCYRHRMLPKHMKNLKNLIYLDITGCNSLICMPVHMGQMLCLRKLSIFIVGKDQGCGIDQLRGLDLVGELSIKELEKVICLKDARSPSLVSKQNLRSMKLSWQIRESNGDPHENEEEVLTGLQPPSSLEKLEIRNYEGSRFPNWMRDSLEPNLVEIILDNCGRCESLPHLGKLSFLKVLNVRKMGALKFINYDFYGDGETSFPSLEALRLQDMLCLEEWATLDGRDSFPRLNELEIDGCPQLVKVPILPSLKKLSIGKSNVTLLRSVIDFTTPTSLWIYSFDNLAVLPDGLFQNHSSLESLEMSYMDHKSLSNQLANLSAIKDLSLMVCKELQNLPEELENLNALEKLQILDCGSLVGFPVNGLRGLSSLTSLDLSNCVNFESLSEGVQYLTALQDLFIAGCPKLKELPERIQHLTSLQKLVLVCVGLTYLPNQIEHLTSLLVLKIGECCNLRSLPHGLKMLNALDRLIIDKCPHLKKRCEEGTGEDWPNIAHIPNVEFWS